MRAWIGLVVVTFVAGAALAGPPAQEPEAYAPGLGDCLCCGWKRTASAKPSSSSSTS